MSLNVYSDLANKLFDHLRIQPSYELVREPVERLFSAQAMKYREGIEQALKKSLKAWRAALKGEELGAVRFYFAGAEVDPWVPQEALASGYGKHTYNEGIFRAEKVLFRDTGGFSLDLMTDLFLDDGQEPAWAGAELYGEVKNLFLLKTLELTVDALGNFTKEAEFTGMPSLRPLRFFANRGHDEPVELLLEISA